MDTTLKSTRVRLVTAVIAAAIVALAIVAFASPASAQAQAAEQDGLTATSATSATSAASTVADLDTQAAKTKVWVITKCNMTLTGDVGKQKAKNTYSYNKYGLISKSSQTDISGVTIYRTADKNSYSYSSKGNYTGWSFKWKDSYGDWRKSTFEFEHDGKKRVKNVYEYVGDEHDSYYASYNSKGRCKAYESGGGEYKFAYNGKGLVTSRKYYSSFGVEVPDGKPNNTRKFTRNKKGDVTKYKVTNFIDDKFYTDTTTVKNKYKSGRLASWTKTPNSSQVNMDEKVTGKFTWKKISVPKKLAAKVKAQQRWIIDSTMTDVDFNQMALPLVVVNK